MANHDASVPDDDQARAIRDALAASGPSTTAELAATLESHPMTVERRCRALQRRGDLRQCSGGVYALADADATDRLATHTADRTGDESPSPPASAD